MTNRRNTVMTAMTVLVHAPLPINYDPTLLLLTSLPILPLQAGTWFYWIITRGNPWQAYNQLRDSLTPVSDTVVSILN